MSNLHITVYLPEGSQFDIDATGVSNYVDTALVRKMPLAEAEKRLEAALRSVRVLLEVEPGREASYWRTTRQDDPTASSPAPSQPYCPFCGGPTCQCWMGHVCR